MVPQPSADPHDPLSVVPVSPHPTVIGMTDPSRRNWSPLWKGLCIAASTSVSFTQGFGPLALAPMFPYYIKDFESNLADVVKFTGIAILVLGFSNFIW